MTRLEVAGKLREEALSEIAMQFRPNEASTLLRALAIARQKAASTNERDDLELLHGRIYDLVYRNRKQGARVAPRARVVQISPVPQTWPAAA